jgi:hypothetical protein
MWNNFSDWVMDGGHVYIGLVSIILSTAIHFALSRHRTRQLAIELLLMYSIGVAGFRGIFGGFVVHYFFADEVARSIGWATGSPFQTEMAFANLAVGVLGAASFWRRDFWLPFIIVSSILGWGAGFIHLRDMAQIGNLAPNNAGPILYADLLMPLARIILYVLYHRGTS